MQQKNKQAPKTSFKITQVDASIVVRHTLSRGFPGQQYIDYQNRLFAQIAQDHKKSFGNDFVYLTNTFEVVSMVISREIQKYFFSTVARFIKDRYKDAGVFVSLDQVIQDMKAAWFFRESVNLFTNQVERIPLSFKESANEMTFEIFWEKFDLINIWCIESFHGKPGLGIPLPDKRWAKR